MSFYFLVVVVGEGGGGRGVVLVFFFMTEQQKHRPIQNAENFLKVPLDFDNFLGEDGCPTRKCPLVV